MWSQEFPRPFLGADFVVSKPDAAPDAFPVCVDLAPKSSPRPMAVSRDTPGPRCAASPPRSVVFLPTLLRCEKWTGSPPLQIGLEAVRGLLSKDDNSFLVPLANHANGLIGEILDSRSDHFRDAAAGGIYKFEQGAVPYCLSGVDEPFHFSDAQESRQFPDYLVVRDETDRRGNHCVDFLQKLEKATKSVFPLGNCLRTCALRMNPMKPLADISMRDLAQTQPESEVDEIPDGELIGRDGVL